MTMGNTDFRWKRCRMCDGKGKVTNFNLKQDGWITDNPNSEANLKKQLGVALIKIEELLQKEKALNERLDREKLIEIIYKFGGWPYRCKAHEILADQIIKLIREG